jgi:hypothetical protein
MRVLAVEFFSADSGADLRAGRGRLVALAEAEHSGQQDTSWGWNKKSTRASIVSMRESLDHQSDAAHRMTQ